MVTVYTSAVADGTITELEPFIMNLARAMGALVSMRDEPMRIPIPERFEVSPHHATALAEAIAERDRLMAMSDADCDKEQKAQLRETLKAQKDAKARRKIVRDNCRAMLEKVRAWEHGAPRGIANLAVEQLELSIQDEYPEGYDEEDTGVMNASEWRNAKIAKELDSIAYNAEMHSKEIALTAERNEWLSQLRASLVPFMKEN